MNILNDKEEKPEVKILLKKIKLYLLSGVMLFISLMLIAYAYFLETGGSFIFLVARYAVAFGSEDESILSIINLLTGLSLVTFITSIVFFAKALFTKISRPESGV